MNIGFIGLGNIGAPLAGRLLGSGHKLVVHDLDRARADELVAGGAAWADSPLETARDTDCLITSLPSPQAACAVIEGKDGALEGFSRGATWIETSTNDADEVKRLAGLLSERGVNTLEATLTLGVHKIASSEGTIFAGGDRDVFEAHASIFEALGGQVFYMGELGKATVIKVITNLVAFVNTIGIAEGVMLAQRAGIDTGEAWKAIGASYGTSYALETAMAVVLGGTYDDDFAIELACKDLRLGRDIAKAVGFEPDLINKTGEIFEWARQKFGDRAFCSEAVRYVEERAGEELRAAGFPEKLTTEGTVPEL